MRVKLGDIFQITSGDYHAVAELDAGTVPLVSCGDVNHGFLGLFDIPPENTYADCITVAYNGQPLTAKFRPYGFGAKDDVGVMIPHQPLGQLTLVYIAGQINALRWRFSYGRKCFKDKLSRLEIDVPAYLHDGTVRIDEGAIAEVIPLDNLDLRPDANDCPSNSVPAIAWETKKLSELFELKRGDFHSLQDLDEGDVPTVSRTEKDNGVVGYFEQPERSATYEAGHITVSTVSGDAFVQMTEFMATDNVIICVPRKPIRVSTAYFIAAMINSQKWRYSYGRQCYLDKLAALTFGVPWREGEMDEAAMEQVVKGQPYWPYIQTQLVEVDGQEALNQATAVTNMIGGSSD